MSYRRVTEEADADKQQPDTDTQQVGTDDREIDSITVNTVGINSQQLQEELDAAVANADTDGDNIGTESTDKIDPSAILQDAKAEIERIEIPHNEQIELVAMYGDDSDSTRINVGERGAATEETALVTVDPDGSVSVNLDIACH
ncbi:hypothetical protein C483_00065 [Natrialba hulunbeirensis JCM 10989]|uniref:Uncharacterized protein n=1 Tax=Natrialba hulunbeirensis JCM 10989 TaxID=1227493 RepID=M0AFQ0_9EURY|nr:hypothetical protein C483_00065 [Natrialba hulunbeirensis JCM 10989]